MAVEEGAAHEEKALAAVHQPLLEVGHPFACGLDFEEVAVGRIAVEQPQVPLGVEGEARNDGVVGVHPRGKFAVAAVEGVFEHAVVEGEQAAAGTYGHMGRVGGVDGQRLRGHEVQSAFLLHVFVEERPGLAVALHLLHHARRAVVGEVAEAAAGGIESAVGPGQLVEFVVAGAAGAQLPHLGQQLRVDVLRPWGVVARALPVGFVEQVGRERGRIKSVGGAGSIKSAAFDVAMVYAEAQVVGLADLRLAGVELHNAEARAEIGVFALRVEAVDGLVARDGGGVVGGQVADVATVVEQVYVLVRVDDDEPAGRRVVADVGDVAVAQAAGLVEGL